MTREEKKLEKSKETLKRGRREFLKEAVYAAPTLIILGGLLKPNNARAGFGGSPSDPTWQNNPGPGQRRPG